jgi:O-antigen/teichoic acid export membrane protein
MFPRFLGAEALGQLTIVMTITTVASFALVLGIPDYLVRRVALKPQTLQRDIAAGTMVGMATSLCGALVLAVVIPLVGAPIPDNRLLYVMLVGMLAQPIQGAVTATLRGRERHAQYAWFNAAGAVGGAVTGTLLLFAGVDVVGLSASVSIVTIGTAVVGYKLSGLQLPRLTFDSAQIRECIRGGIPFLALNLGQVISANADRVVLGVLVPAAQVGWYAAAARIVFVPIFVPMVVATPLFAAVSRASATHDSAAIRRVVAESLRAVLLLTVPLCAGLIATAPALPGFLHWPSDFDNAVPLMQVLSLSIPLMAVDIVLGAVVVGLGSAGRWARITLVAATLNPLANLAFVPLLNGLTGEGAIGASIVRLLTELFMFGGVMLLIPRNLLDVRTIWVTVRILLAGVATAAATSALLSIGLLPAILGGALVYVASVFALRVVGVEDARQLAARKWG